MMIKIMIIRVKIKINFIKVVFRALKKHKYKRSTKEENKKNNKISKVNRTYSNKKKNIKKKNN